MTIYKSKLDNMVNYAESKETGRKFDIVKVNGVVSFRVNNIVIFTITTEGDWLFNKPTVGFMLNSNVDLNELTMSFKKLTIDDSNGGGCC